jgi:hypothetical protein
VNQRTIWLGALTTCGLVAILLVSIIVIPRWLYPPLSAADLRGVLGAQARIQLQQAQSQLANDARSSILQGLAGLIVAATAAGCERYGVAARGLNHREAGPFGHGALRGLGNHPVVGRNQVPAGLGAPRGLGDRPAEGGYSPRDLRIGQDAACSAGRSEANDPANFPRSMSRKPSRGGRIGGTAAPGGGSAIKVFTDSPLSGATAAM